MKYLAILLICAIAALFCAIGCSEQDRQKAEQTIGTAQQYTHAAGQVAATMPAGPVKDAATAGVTTAEIILGAAAAVLGAWGELQRRKAKANSTTRTPPPV